MYIALAFSVYLVFSTLCIWIASKFSFVQLSLQEIMVIVVFISITALLPVVGFIVSLILFIYLVMRYSGCSAFDAAAVGLFTNIFAFAGVALVAATSTI